MNFGEPRNIFQELAGGHRATEGIEPTRQLLQKDSLHKIILNNVCTMLVHMYAQYVYNTYVFMHLYVYVCM